MDAKCLGIAYQGLRFAYPGLSASLGLGFSPFRRQSACYSWECLL